jgi:CDP-diacylglycerol--glycerol-3-phosphate 3-phosphatidyltransferase/cardiolipin synthase
MANSVLFQSCALSALRNGARLDTLADFVFLLMALMALASRDLLSWMVPLVSVAMFGQFWLARGPLVYDPIGKYYGAFLFGLVGVVTFLSDEAAIGFYLFTGASVISRLFSTVIRKQLHRKH